MSNIAILASGNGTNVQAIAEFFLNHTKISVSLILSNKPDAYVLKRAEKLKIPAIVFNKESFYNTVNILDTLTEYKIDFIVLAGFLWLMPENILNAYKNKIINIHPALLPKYGGKGMYGSRVHEAIIRNHENETGITIHYVNEAYDSGAIIFQARCHVSPFDTAEMVAQKVHRLEHHYYPQIIEKVVLNKPNLIV